MNILIMAPDYPPEVLAGLEVLTKDLAGHLAKKHMVTVLTTGKRKIEKRGNLTVIRTQKIFKNRILYNIQETLFFIKNSLKLNPDIILGHMVTSAGLAAVIAGKLQRKPVIVRISGAEILYPNLFKNIFLKPILKLADAIVTPNSSMIEDVRKLVGGKKILYLPQGIDISNVSKHVRKLNKTPRIIYVGRLIPVKNLTMLIKVSKLLPNYKFVIVGDGPEKDRLRKIAPDNVSFLGLISQKEVIKEMKKSDVFVLTSISESFGRVLIEALACGLPIVAVNSQGPKDIIKDGSNGYLINLNDAKDMADKVKLAIKNKNEIGSYNLRDVDRFSWNQVLPQYESLHESLIRANKNNGEKS